MNVKNIAVLCYEAGECLGKVGAAGDPISACSDPVHRAFLEHMKAARDSFVPPLTRERLQEAVGDEWKVERERDRWVFRLEGRSFVLLDTADTLGRRILVRAEPCSVADVLAMADAVRAVGALL